MKPDIKTLADPSHSSTSLKASGIPPYARPMSLLTGSIVTTSTSIVPSVAGSAAPTVALVLSLRFQRLGLWFCRGLLYIVHLLVMLIAAMYAPSLIPRDSENKS